jgi:hypothetical protein
MLRKEEPCPDSPIPPGGTDGFRGLPKFRVLSAEEEMAQADAQADRALERRHLWWLPGDQPDALPDTQLDTPDKLLSECERIRKHQVKLSQESARGVRIDTSGAWAAYLCDEDGLEDVYPLPDLEPLWNAMWALNLGGEPPWLGEPQTGPETFEALDTLMDWCRQHSASPPATQVQGESAPAARTPASTDDAVASSDNPYADLRSYATNELTGKEQRVIELLCEQAGQLPLADLAVDPTIQWSRPWDNSWDSLKRRLNIKLRRERLPYRLVRQKGKARIAPVENPSKKT